MAKRWATGFGVLVLAWPVAARGGETTVTTYVIKTQEEREKTRWTLTEWLRIKERMKMMDVWLAMFSDPKKDEFRPELNVGYALTRGDLRVNGEGAAAREGTLAGTQLKGQLWLTNLVSGTLGVRTLNVDLGVEGGLRGTGAYEAKASAAALGAAAASGGPTPKYERRHGTVNLRLFGKNIQDTSLVLKYGQYGGEDTSLAAIAFAEDPVATTGARKTAGQTAGADLQLYVLKSLGAEGSYQRFGSAARYDDTKGDHGVSYMYAGFVEVSLIRLMFGRYGEDWSMLRTEDGKRFRVREDGTFAGIKIQI